eukprot:scaffold559013_cov83-Attheya_sp.AAC.1
MSAYAIPVYIIINNNKGHAAGNLYLITTPGKVQKESSIQTLLMLNIQKNVMMGLWGKQVGAGPLKSQIKSCTTEQECKKESI